MNKLLSKRNVIVFMVLIAVLLLGLYIENRPRTAPGQEPLTDIQNIDTLRTQFNRDVGKTRLIILVSPT
jgi:hypothetical protein